MTDRLARGTLEHCLSQGHRAACLLKRFESVVADDEMGLVRYWFEELHREADHYLGRGYELVSVGFDNREDWCAGPFMVFNPTRWIGPRRRLISPTTASNPRQWVTIRIRSLTKPVRVFLTPARGSRPDTMPLIPVEPSTTSRHSHKVDTAHHLPEPALHD